MTLDLAHLRQLAEESRDANRRLRKSADAIDIDYAHDADDELARELTPTVVLELLDRLERAQRKLDLLDERLHAYAGREELLAVLATGEPVFPTLMTQVGRKT